MISWPICSSDHSYCVSHAIKHRFLLCMRHTGHKNTTPPTHPPIKTMEALIVNCFGIMPHTRLVSCSVSWQVSVLADANCMLYALHLQYMCSIFVKRWSEADVWVIILSSCDSVSLFIMSRRVSPFNVQWLTFNAGLGLLSEMAAVWGGLLMFRGHFVFSRWMAGSCLSEPVSFCRIEKTKDRECNLNPVVEGFRWMLMMHFAYVLFNSDM